jgi:hypothetical protein
MTDLSSLIANLTLPGFVADAPPPAVIVNQPQAQQQQQEKKKEKPQLPVIHIRTKHKDKKKQKIVQCWKVEAKDPSKVYMIGYCMKCRKHTEFPVERVGPAKNSQTETAIGPCAANHPASTTTYIKTKKRKVVDPETHERTVKYFEIPHQSRGLVSVVRRKIQAPPAVVDVDAATQAL